MVNFPISRSFLIAGVVQGALWGIYSTVFVAYVLLFVSQRREEQPRRRRPSLLHIATCLLYLLATAHLCICSQRLVEAFTLYPTEKLITPDEYYSQTGGSDINLNIAKEVIYLLIGLIGDSILVWRCYALWGSTYWYVIVLPILLMISTLVGALGAAGLQFSPKPSTTLITALGTLFFCSSFATNILATLLLSGRIWFLSRRSSRILQNDPDRFSPIVKLLLETGAVIAAAKIAEFTLFLVAPVTGLKPGNNAVYLVFDSMPQILSLFPTLLIMLVISGYTSKVSKVSGRKDGSASIPPILFKSGPTSRTFYSQSVPLSVLQNASGMETSTQVNDADEVAAVNKAHSKCVSSYSDGALPLKGSDGFIHE